jgi:ketosteroid isomerase-like protein
MSRKEIDALNATFVAGFEKADADLVASVYAADARLLPPGSESVTGAAIREYWQGVLDAGVTGCVLRTASSTEHGDVTIDEGRYEIRVGEEVVDTGHYVTVHDRLSDGTWSCDLDIWNSSRLPAPRPSR